MRQTALTFYTTWKDLRDHVLPKGSLEHTLRTITLPIFWFSIFQTGLWLIWEECCQWTPGKLSNVLRLLGNFSDCFLIQIVKGSMPSLLDITPFSFQASKTPAGRWHPRQKSYHFVSRCEGFVWGQFFFLIRVWNFHHAAWDLPHDTTSTTWVIFSKCLSAVSLLHWLREEGSSIQHLLKPAAIPCFENLVIS